MICRFKGRRRLIFVRTYAPSLERTSLYSERMSSVTSQVKVPSSSQCRRSEALGFSTARRDLNPATPATSTDVSMTPLGCVHRRHNRNLRQLLLLSPEAPRYGLACSGTSAADVQSAIS